jgi:hypothetical protein
MKSAAIAVALLGAAILAPGTAVAQQSADFGKREYNAACAACHGATGRGDGPYAGIVDSRIADLTTLAKRNNGVFPFQRVYEYIDGSRILQDHESRDMPVWALEYRVQAGDARIQLPHGPGAYARSRIFALTEYVSRLQVK